MLDAALDALRARLSEGDLRWVPGSQRHLTFRFFDELPEDRVEDVRGAAGAAAAETARFDLELEGLGCFPPHGPAKVVWAGCGGGREALAGLASALSLALAGRGFPGDTRPFAPHLTLARARSPRGSRDAARAVAALAPSVGTLGVQAVDALVLYRSDLGAGPPVHTSLGHFALSG